MTTEICFLPARELTARIRNRELSARETMEAHLTQIERLNPRVNAIVSMTTPEFALDLADQADRKFATGACPGALHGLPWAVKDLSNAAGFPTIAGSPLNSKEPVTSDDLFVERIRNAGALIIGKTNTPEFGLGSHTYNTVFGATRNPWDPSKSAGGSSGGAAAAIASGMLPLADGSDMGGSLRNPGNFNSVIGFRPSPGTVPAWPSQLAWSGMSVYGPLARDVEDAALLLSAMAGADPRDQRAIPLYPQSFLQPLHRDFDGVRVAWSPDLGGLPLDRRVREVLDNVRGNFEALGCVVEEADPQLEPADRTFLDLRAGLVAARYADLLDAPEGMVKPEAIWNVEAGLSMSAQQFGDAMIRQQEIFERFRQFMTRYEFLLCAVNQVPPFPVEWDWPHEIEGVPMEHYIAWMKSAYWITVTQSPAISVPAGFTTDGLPVGMQIVGRFREDFGVLQLAHAFEQTTGLIGKHPAIAE